MSPDPPPPARDDGRTLLEIPSSGHSTTVTFGPGDREDTLSTALWDDCFQERKGILFGNLVSEVEREQVVTGEMMGRVAPHPDPRSKRFETELRSAEALYQEQRYAEAAAALQPAYASKVYDAFVVNAYARALYWSSEQGRLAAFPVYQHLVRALDASGAARAPEHLYVDVWFPDAYWKLATLHLDRGEYREAICQIARSLYGSSGSNGQPQSAYLQQAHGYLAEAYFELGRADRADAHAREALRWNPANESLRKYLLEP